MKPRRNPSPARNGSALITTLLVVVVMSIIVVAFLQSMTMERQTARSYLNRFRAELAATAATDMAKALIYETINKKAPGKVNFVTWGYSPDPATFSPFFTGILPDAIPTEPSQAPTSGVNSVADTVWLFSGPGPEAGKGSNPTEIQKLGADDASKDKVCNINFPISSSRNPDTDPSSEGSTTQRYWIDQSGTEYNVGWMQLPVPDNPTLAVRYAFWVDDEMGRADLGVLGNDDQKVPKGDKYYVTNPEDFKGSSNLAINDADKAENGDQPYLTSDDTKKIVADRELVGMSPLSANQLITAPDPGKKTPPNPDLARDSLRITAHVVTAETSEEKKSKSPNIYDLIPYGAKAGKLKMNLNTAVSEQDDSRESVKKIHDFLATALAKDKSDDGETVDENDKAKTSVYFRRKNSPPGTAWRIAASIHDYIDDEKYPTMAQDFDDHFSKRLENAYKFVFEKNGQGDPDQPVTPDWEETQLDQRWYGIKPVPFFNAFDFNGTMNSTKEPYNDYTARYTFYLWNPSDKIFDLKDCYIMVFNTSFHSAANATRADNGSNVEGLPYYRWDVFRLPVQTVQPMQQLPIVLTKNYKINGSTKSATLNTTSTLGFVLFKRGDDAKIHVLDGFIGGGLLSYNRDSKSPGGQVTGASNEWDTKDRRQNLSLHQSIWSTATTAIKGNLANFQDLKRWYDRPDSLDAPTTAITHIALGPMKSLGELGNIFDPVNDLSVGVGTKYPTGGTFALRVLPPSSGSYGGGTYVSRGGKTLDVGQFDEFFDRLQDETPKNPMLDDSKKWTAYEKYLRFGDAALFDMFTIRTPEESRKIRPLNVNAPRPGKLTETKTPGDPGLSPMSTYLGAMTSALGADALGGTDDKTKKPVQGIVSGIQSDSFFSRAIRERITDAADWTKCRPFRNYNDLMLLGIKKDKLEKDIQANGGQSVFAAKNASPATGTTPPFYLTKRAAVSVTLGTPPAGPTGTGTVQQGTSFQRQAPFARLAEQTTFRSYRYRIYAVGQVVLKKNPTQPLSTVHQSFIYDLNPKYDEASETVIFHPTLQSVVDN